MAVTSRPRAAAGAASSASGAASEGWHGWDSYAAFYDWENARTLGRRDVAFWQGVVRGEARRTLELGCGTGRLLMPMARTGVPVIGIDRSAPMLERAWTRRQRLSRAHRPGIVRGDIRSLPFPARSFGAVIAPYGLLQSLISDEDLDSTLRDVARVLKRGGLLGIDLVPDLTTWAEYHRKVSLQGRLAAGTRVTLVESVRQDRERKLTIFDEEFVTRRGTTETKQQFSLVFRTLAVVDVVDWLARTGFRVESRYGSYARAPWQPTSDVWLLLARKK